MGTRAEAVEEELDPLGPVRRRLCPHPQAALRGNVAPLNRYCQISLPLRVLISQTPNGRTSIQGRLSVRERSWRCPDGFRWTSINSEEWIEEVPESREMVRQLKEKTSLQSPPA